MLFIPAIRHISINICQQQSMSVRNQRKKVDFFERCQQIRKSNRRNVSFIYNEFTQIRFFQIYAAYQNSYNKNKENNEQYEKDRAEMIAFGCLSNYDEFDRCHKSEEKKQQFNKLTDFAQDLGEEKAIKKVAIMNTIGQIQRMAAFHKELLQRKTQKEPKSQ